MDPAWSLSLSIIFTLDLCEQDETFKVKKVEATLSKRLQQARLAKGMTQKALAQAINEKPQVVNEYESGKAIPSSQIISKMERALGAKLRGKWIKIIALN